MILDNYIEQDFIKQIFMESCLIITDIDQAECLAKSLDINYRNIIFETSYLKSIFFNKLKVYYPEVLIVNCDSSKKRLLKDIEKYDDDIIVFDKVNYCTDFDIFNMINKLNRILVC